MWAHYFEEHFSTVISRGAVLLNKDFCLFSEGSRFLLVASTETVRRGNMAQSGAHPSRGRLRRRGPRRCTGRAKTQRRSSRSLSRRTSRSTVSTSRPASSRTRQEARHREGEGGCALAV